MKQRNGTDYQDKNIRGGARWCRNTELKVLGKFFIKLMDSTVKHRFLMKRHWSAGKFFSWEEHGDLAECFKNNLGSVNQALGNTMKQKNTTRRGWPSWKWFSEKSMMPPQQVVLIWEVDSCPSSWTVEWSKWILRQGTAYREKYLQRVALWCRNKL